MFRHFRRSVKLRKHFFFENRPFSEPKTGFLKNRRVERGGGQYPRPSFFLCRYPVHKTGESLYPQVALVLPPRPNRNGVLPNVRKQFFAVCLGRSDVFFA
jgi:hypothetical protein